MENCLDQFLEKAGYADGEDLSRLEPLDTVSTFTDISRCIEGCGMDSLDGYRGSPGPSSG
jgi:hypothetical protein